MLFGWKLPEMSVFLFSLPLIFYVTAVPICRLRFFFAFIWSSFFFFFFFNEAPLHRFKSSTHCAANTTLKQPHIVLISLMSPKQLWPVRRWAWDTWGCPVVRGTGTMALDPLGLVGWGVGRLFLLWYRCIRWIGLGSGEFGGQVKALGSLSSSLIHS